MCVHLCVHERVHVGIITYYVLPPNFAHDRFLRGTCDKTDGNCPFSHQITKEKVSSCKYICLFTKVFVKMPVCSYFLRGVCTKDNCPYLHVYVGENAEICQDFAKGFCPNGDKVRIWIIIHTVIVWHFSVTRSIFWTVLTLLSQGSVLKGTSVPWDTRRRGSVRDDLHQHWLSLKSQRLSKRGDLLVKQQ